jgi:DNA-binding transcriptional MerR regulator
MNPIENISEIAKKSTPEEFKKIIGNLTPDHIILAIHAIKDQHFAIMRQKMRILLEEFKESKHLEAIGNALSLDQILLILDLMNNGEVPHWKLSPMLVRMPLSLFNQLLFAASLSQINILKQEVFTEALQHQLTLMTHEIVQQIPELTLRLDTIEQKIANINLDEVTSSQITSLTQEIEHCANNYQAILEKINKLLTLTWNTNRSDLIEKLSSCKEIAQKLMSTKVGNSKTIIASSTGLFAYLEQRLSEVFEGFKTQHDVEALDDDEPSIEALVKFSLWYLRDYWEVGLLPAVKNPIDLDQPHDNLLKNNRVHTREELYHQVNVNLSKLKLKTVGDLKQHKIFSKATLIEYIEAHQHLLKY